MRAGKRQTEGVRGLLNPVKCLRVSPLWLLVEAGVLFRAPRSSRRWPATELAAPSLTAGRRSAEQDLGGSLSRGAPSVLMSLFVFFLKVLMFQPRGPFSMPGQGHQLQPACRTGAQSSLIPSEATEQTPSDNLICWTELLAFSFA